MALWARWQHVHKGKYHELVPIYSKDGWGLSYKAKCGQLHTRRSFLVMRDCPRHKDRCGNCTRTIKRGS